MARLLLWLLGAALVGTGFMLLVDKYRPHDDPSAADQHRYPIGTTVPDWDRFKQGPRAA